MQSGRIHSLPLALHSAKNKAIHPIVETSKSAHHRFYDVCYEVAGNLPHLRAVSTYELSVCGMEVCAKRNGYGISSGGWEYHQRLF